MFNSKEVRKGFLLNTCSDADGALNDPRSTQKLRIDAWSSSSHNNASGNEGWDEHLKNNRSSGWGMPSNDECNGGDHMVEDCKDEESISDCGNSSTMPWGSVDKENGVWDKYLKNKTPSRWGAPSNGEFNGDDPMMEGKKTETSILDNTPFLPRSLGVPKNSLSNWYGKRHKDMTFATNKCFTTWDDNGPAHALYFTSIFTCPVTGEMFSCGKHGDVKTYKVENEEISEGVDEEEGDNSERRLNPIIWYRKKLLAEHSAAARALDCLSFREGDGSDGSSYYLCMENPYMIAADAPPLSASAPKILNYPLEDEMQICDTKENDKSVNKCSTNTLVILDEEGRNDFASMYNAVIAKKKDPKGTLIRWYEKNHKDYPVSSSCYITWHDDGPSHDRRHSTIFKCPRTGEIFSCGQYGEEKNYKLKEEEPSSEDLGGSAEIGSVSVVWYRRKNLAEQAAAARVLDCLTFRKGGDNSSMSHGLCIDKPRMIDVDARETQPAHIHSIRLCIEDPYASPDDAPPISSRAPAELYT